MRPDLDEIRREAEHHATFVGDGPAAQDLAHHCLALLNDLDQAQAKLATVPALVQILHRYYEAMALERGAGRPLDPDTYTLLLADAREALAAWEAAQ